MSSITYTRLHLGGNCMNFISLDSYIRKIENELAEKSLFTYEHSLRVANYAMLIAEDFYPEDELWMIELAGKLHDIGKLSVDSSILEKATRLTDTEYEEIKNHPLYGLDLLKDGLKRLSFGPKFEDLITQAVRHHHERFDGKGYPFNLKGKQIPLISRIMCVADSFDAIHAKRPYNDSMSLTESLAEIERNMGTQFDPEIAVLFIDKMKKAQK